MKKNRLTALFLVTTVIFAAVSGVLGLNMIQMSRNNSFSKNISLDNNYFLADYTEMTATDSNAYSAEVVYDEAVSDVYAEISDEEIFAYDIDELRSWGIIDDESYYSITEVLNSEGLFSAQLLANELLGEPFFTPIGYGHHIDVPYISQVGILPNGCEAVSAIMLLHYNGYNTDPVDFVDNYLEKGEVYTKWGCRYGPNPKTAYAGDPKSEKGGWGCFAPVIIKALNKYLGSEMFAKNLTGLSLDELAQQYITNDIPVAVWVTQDMEEINKLYQWQSYNKEETFLYPVHEHCMVFTGFDDEYYYFNDPLSEEKYVKYEKDTASACYNSMGRQAVAVVE